jgi:Cu-processing system permease protein
MRYDLFSSPAELAVTLLAVVLVGLSKGGLAGLGMLGVPLMALVMSPVTAAAVLLPVLVVMDVVSVVQWRRWVDWAILRRVLPGAAAGIAIGVWLFFVVIFDMALLGILVADSKQAITAPMLETILLFNPADVYRLLNLTGYENTAMYAGMAGLSGQLTLGMPVLVAAQLLWIALPFALAAWIFRKRQI